MPAVNSTIAQLAQAFAAANVDMLAVRLPVAHVVEVTDTLVRRWNARREELDGLQLVRYGTGPLSARHVLAETPEGQRQFVEITYVSPLGEARASRFIAQEWQEGDDSYMVLIGQQLAEAEISEIERNERRLRLALRSGGYALWDHDFRTGATFNAPEMYDLLGFERGSPDLNFHTFNQRIHADDRDKTLDRMIMEAPFGLDTFQTRYRVMGRGGKYIWIESIAGVIRNPADGKPDKCVGLSRNIDEHMAVVERLQAQERILRRSQEAARLGSFSIDLASGETRLSQEMIALIDMGDAIVEPDLSVFAATIEAADQARFEIAITRAREGLPVTPFEIVHRTFASQELHDYEVKIEGLRDEQGQLVSLFGTCQCITERKMLERKFLQAQKMEAVGQLTGGIAHDFNNLLMVVLGNLQLVEQITGGDERARKRIRAATEAAERGSELTKRLLAYSRQQNLQNREIDIDALIASMHEILVHAIGADVDLRILPGTATWAVRADPTMLETAILNLCINARDAMKPKGGKLTIETSNRSLNANASDMEDVTPGDYVEIIVTDTGCGIAPENIEKVFQPFFTTKGPEAGSGLGLSMIYGFAKQSGGHIRIYSELGHGTAMKLYLPRLVKDTPALPVATPAPAAAPVLVAEPEVATPAAQRPAVLIVEDSAAVREVAAAMIEDMEMEPLVAASGAEALAIIESRPDIALVLSDIVMAGMNGPEMAIRAQRLRPSLKILFMTGYAADNLRLLRAELPAPVELVNKPFTRADLAAKVKRALAA